MFNRLKQLANKALSLIRSAPAPKVAAPKAPAPKPLSPWQQTLKQNNIDTRPQGQRFPTPYKNQQAYEAAIREQQRRAKEEVLRKKQAELDQAKKKWKAKKTPVPFKTQAQKNVFVDGKPQTSANIAEEEARLKTQELINKKKAYSGSGWLDRLKDKVTFGETRRASSSRSFAEQLKNQNRERGNKLFDEKLAAHQKLWADLNADFAARQAKLSPKDQQKLAEEYDRRIKKSAASLENFDATLRGIEGAADDESRRKLPGKVGGLISWTNRNVAQKGKGLGTTIARYTIGQGSENLPSAVTALGRGVSWLQNLNTNNRTIYKNDGSSFNRLESGKNSWQATFNARRTAPYKEKPFDKKQAYKDFTLAQYNTWKVNELKKAGSGGGNFKSDLFKGGKYNYQDNSKIKGLKSYDDWVKEQWQKREKFNQSTQSGIEELTDPTNYIGLGSGSAAKQGTTRAAKLTKFLSETRAGSFIERKAAPLINAAKDTKAAGWVKSLNKEYKLPGERLVEELGTIKRTLGNSPELKRVNEIAKEIAKGSKYDLKVLDDLENLHPAAFGALQRSVGGKLALRDRLMLAGKNSKATRDHIEEIIQRYNKFTDEQKLADSIKYTRFGGKKRLYSPNVAWTRENLDNYNYRLFKKNKNLVQSKEDFLFGVKHRLTESNLQKKILKEGVRDKELTSEMLTNWKKYSKQAKKAEKDSIAARSKFTKKTTGVTQWARNKSLRDEVSVGRSLVNTGRKTLEAPTKLWKKSVLKYRPAWAVNNAAFNAQAAVQAGGLGALAEQARLLKPKYWREAMAESRKIAGSNISKEIGQKGLTKFHTGIEDWSRVAAFRSLKKKGFSDEAALKRVNNYLFDYTTKNFERPIKAVIPFYQFQKNLAKASTRLVLDKPLIAKLYNKLDKYQSEGFDKEFETIRSELKAQGYSDSEIDAFKEENRKYYEQKFKKGSKFFNNPFVGYSEKGLSGFGVNPYISAAAETIDAQDQYGRSIGGRDASFTRRLVSKFPQAELARQGYNAYRVQTGKLKPSEKWIGGKGSDGYGLTKEKQGYDKSKKNYVKSLDPRDNLDSKLKSFVGIPSSVEFDKSKFLETKRMAKLTSEYFSMAGTGVPYKDKYAAQEALFKKYGVTADDFYKGILAKYDSDMATKTKALKEDAANKNKSLFEEYGKQPYGTRSAWAVKKLAELNKQGYFNDNPYLKGFKFVSSETVTKANKKAAYDKAKASGDWTAFNKTYGKKTSQKAIDYRRAKASGDWTDYKKKYGTRGDSAKAKFWQAYTSEPDLAKRRQILRDNPQYAKNAVKSEAEIAEATFWYEYQKASKAKRKEMLAKNPQYNKRQDWTASMWDAWKAENKAKERSTLNSFGDFGTKVNKNLAFNKQKAFKVTWGKSTTRAKKASVRWRV